MLIHFENALSKMGQYFSVECTKETSAENQQYDMTLEIGESQIPIELFQNIFEFLGPKDVAKFIISTKPTYQHYKKTIKEQYELYVKEKIIIEANKVRKSIQKHLKKRMIPITIPKKCGSCGISLLGTEFWSGLPTEKTNYQVVKHDDQYHIFFEIGICQSCYNRDRSICEKLHLESPKRYLVRCFCNSFKTNISSEKCSKCETQLNGLYFVASGGYNLCQKCTKDTKEHKCQSLLLGQNRYHY